MNYLVEAEVRFRSEFIYEAEEGEDIFDKYGHPDWRIREIAEEHIADQIWAGDLDFYDVDVEVYEDES